MRCGIVLILLCVRSLQANEENSINGNPGERRDLQYFDDLRRLLFSDEWKTIERQMKTYIDVDDILKVVEILKNEVTVSLQQEAMTHSYKKHLSDVNFSRINTIVRRATEDKISRKQHTEPYVFRRKNLTVLEKDVRNLKMFSKMYSINKIIFIPGFTEISLDEEDSPVNTPKIQDNNLRMKSSLLKVNKYFQDVIFLKLCCQLHYKQLCGILFEFHPECETNQPESLAYKKNKTKAIEEVQFFPNKLLSGNVMKEFIMNIRDKKLWTSIFFICLQEMDQFNEKIKNDTLVETCIDFTKIFVLNKIQNIISQYKSYRFNSKNIDPLQTDQFQSSSPLLHLLLKEHSHSSVPETNHEAKHLTVVSDKSHGGVVQYNFETNEDNKVDTNLHVNAALNTFSLTDDSGPLRNDYISLDAYNEITREDEVIGEDSIKYTARFRRSATSTHEDPAVESSDDTSSTLDTSTNYGRDNADHFSNAMGVVSTPIPDDNSTGDNVNISANAIIVEDFGGVEVRCGESIAAVAGGILGLHAARTVLHQTYRGVKELATQHDIRHPADNFLGNLFGKTTKKVTRFVGFSDKNVHKLTHFGQVVGDKTWDGVKEFFWPHIFGDIGAFFRLFKKKKKQIRVSQFLPGLIKGGFQIAAGIKGHLGIQLGYPKLPLINGVQITQNQQFPPKFPPQGQIVIPPHQNFPPLSQQHTTGNGISIFNINYYSQINNLFIPPKGIYIKGHGYIPKIPLDGTSGSNFKTKFDFSSQLFVSNMEHHIPNLLRMYSTTLQSISFMYFVLVPLLPVSVTEGTAMLGMSMYALYPWNPDDDADSGKPLIIYTLTGSNKLNVYDPNTVLLYFIKQPDMPKSLPPIVFNLLDENTVTISRQPSSVSQTGTPFFVLNPPNLEDTRKENLNDPNKYNPGDPLPNKPLIVYAFQPEMTMPPDMALLAYLQFITITYSTTFQTAEQDVNTQYVNL